MLVFLYRISVCFCSVLLLFQPPNGTGVDEADSSFQVKLWTYRVFQELIYWTGSASRTLHLLHTERDADEEVEL